MTFFGNANPRFRPIPEDKCIETGPFLDASRYILPFFEKFGSSFKFVRNDVDGNIEKINKKYQENPEKYKTVNKILEETGVKGDKVLKNAHIGVIWLTRGLDYIQALLQDFVEDYEQGSDPEGGSSEIVIKSYQRTLCQHHGVIMRNIFKPFCKLAPYKPDLFAKFKEAEGVTDGQVIADMKQYHVELAETAAVLQKTIDDLQVKE